MGTIVLVGGGVGKVSNYVIIRISNMKRINDREKLTNLIYFIKSAVMNNTQRVLG